MIISFVSFLCYKPWIFRRKYTSVCVLFTLYRFKSNKAFRMERNREIQTEKNPKVMISSGLVQREYHGSRAPYVLDTTQLQLSFFLRADSHFLRVIFLNTPSLRCHIFFLLALTACTLFNCFPLVHKRPEGMRASTTNLRNT